MERSTPEINPGLPRAFFMTTLMGHVGGRGETYFSIETVLIIIACLIH
jgi:hypothetical protein